jgi:tRNA-binding protein
MEYISYENFASLDIRCGQIISARINTKAKKPAYVLEVDFGDDIGIKTTSAQITINYTLEQLI